MKFKPYSSYKDSGIEWLGEVPEHWEVIYSKWLFQERSTKAYKDDEQLTASQKYGVIPQKEFMRLENKKVMEVIIGHEILKHVEPNDFVISMRSFQGGLEYCTYKGSVSSAYVPLKPKQFICADFFKYLFKSHPYVQALQSTSSLIRDGQALRYNNFIQVPLPNIPLDEQLIIGRFLKNETTHIDGLVEEKNRFIELLKEKRQTLISHVVTQGLDPTVKMKDSGVEWLGEVPEHWKIKRFKFLLKINPSKSEVNHINKDNEVQFLPMELVNVDGTFDLSEVRKLSEVYSGFTYCRDGDVILAKITPCFENGKGALLNKLFNGIAFGSTEFHVLRPLTVFPKFVWFLTKTNQFRKLGSLEMKGAVGQQRIPDSFIANFYIAEPTLTEQTSIANFLDNQTTKIDALITETQNSIALLKEHRTALISAAVTGKIDVREAA